MSTLDRTWKFAAALLLAGSWTFAACTGSVGAPAGGTDVENEEPPPLTDDPPVGDPSVNLLVCDQNGVAALESPLRRLTHQQYRNTLADLLGDLAPVPEDLQLPSETLITGFDNIAVGQTSTLALLQSYRHAATVVAKTATSSAAKLAKLAPCQTGTADLNCANAFIDSFGKRAFRRPLESDEQDRLRGVFLAVAGDHGYAHGVEATLSAMLMAPQFVFRPELGNHDRPEGDAVALGSYEIAARLSYFLWDTMPDADLLAASDDGTLSSREGIEKQARRLLDDPRSHAAVARFQSQWLQTSKLEKLEKDRHAYPDFNQDIQNAMRISLDRFTERAFWEAGSLRAMLTEPRAFVDQKLAAIYEVESGGEMQLMDLDEQRRGGLLTQAGLMAALAKPSYDSPVHRGLFVIEHLLCGDMAPPPPDVPALAEPASGEEPRTTRQRVEITHSNKVCAACHQFIDGIGFGFGHYDAIGKYREQENGIDVDVSGELVGTRDIDGPFHGAIELGRKLAGSTQVHQCVATQWFRYGFGKTETEADACALKPIVDGFIRSRGDFKQLLLTLVTSDAFRYRKAI